MFIAGEARLSAELSCKQSNLFLLRLVLALNPVTGRGSEARTFPQTLNEFVGNLAPDLGQYLLRKAY